MAFFILTDFKLALLAWETFQFMFDYHRQNAHRYRKVGHRVMSHRPN